MKTGTRQYLRFIALCLPLAALFILPRVPGIEHFPEVTTAVREFTKIVTVHRATPSKLNVRADTIDRSSLPAVNFTRINQIRGMDAAQRYCYARVIFTETEDASAVDGGGEDDGDHDDESDISLPTQFFCRLDTTNGGVEWISGNEYVRNPPDDRRLGTEDTRMAWLSSPGPEIDPLTGEPFWPEGPRYKSLWRYTPERGRELICTGPDLRNNFIISADGAWAVCHTTKAGRTQAHVMSRSPQTGEFHPPAAWSGDLDMVVYYIYPGSSIALAAIHFPRLEYWVFTEFVEVDLATGAVRSRLDQADVRCVQRGSVTMISDDAFAVQSRGEVKYGQPHSILSLYATRPLRHMMDVSGVAIFGGRDPGSFFVVDSSENTFRQGHEPELGEGSPILRALNVLTGSESALALGDFSPPISSAVTVDEVLSAWTSNLRDSPASPSDGSLVIPNAEGEAFCHIVDFRTHQAEPVPVERPVRKFRRSPGGRYVALSSAHPSMFLPDTDQVAADPDSPANFTIWDRQTRTVVFTSLRPLLPLRWIDDRDLLLLSTPLDIRRPEPGQHFSLYRYSEGKGLQAIRPEGVMPTR